MDPEPNSLDFTATETNFRQVNYYQYKFQYPFLNCIFNFEKKFPNFLALLFLTCNLLLVTCNLFAQQPTEEWVKRFSWGTHASGNSIKLDSLGNVYVLVNQRSDSTYSDIGLMKYNSEGTQLWSRYYNSAGNKSDFAEGFAVTAGGDVYITGISNLNFYQNIVTVKFNRNGSLQWIKEFDTGFGTDGINDICLDRNENVLITGSATTPSTSAALTIKYDGNGDTIWVRKFNQLSTNNQLNRIAVDDSNNVYLAGSTDTFHSSDYLILKYNSAGNLQWYATYNTFFDYVDVATNICVDSDRNVYVVGINQVLPDYGNTLVKLNSIGVLQWAKLFTGLIYASGGCQNPGGLLVTPDGTALYYTTGCQNEQGRSEIVTLKYGSNGDSVWTRRYPQGVQGTPIFGPTLKFDQYYDIYLAGYKYDLLNSDNYLVLKYLKNGTLQWTAEYNNSLVPASFDEASDLIIDSYQKVYVTGASSKQMSPLVFDAATIKYNQPVAIANGNTELPNEFKLYQNYPNPFNSTTIIDYQIPNNAVIKLTLSDLTGREVRTFVNSMQNAGYYTIAVNMGELASGVYFYRLTADNTVIDVRKLVLVK